MTDIDPEPPYSEAEVDAALDELNARMDAFDTPTEREAYSKSIVAYHMLLTHGQLPGGLLPADIDD